MSAIINGTTVRQLDRPAASEESITEADAAQAPRVARLLTRLLADVANLKRRYWPERLDFEDLAVTSGDVLKLNHGFNGRARWWVVDWQPMTPGDIALFSRTAATDANTLALDVSNSGTVTIRVEAAG